MRSTNPNISLFIIYGNTVNTMRVHGAAVQRDKRASACAARVQTGAVTSRGLASCSLEEQEAE